MCAECSDRSSHHHAIFIYIYIYSWLLVNIVRFHRNLSHRKSMKIILRRYSTVQGQVGGVLPWLLAMEYLWHTWGFCETEHRWSLHWLAIVLVILRVDTWGPLLLFLMILLLMIVVVLTIWVWINPFLMGWTSIYQLFWCSPGLQGFDTLPYYYYDYYVSLPRSSTQNYFVPGKGGGKGKSSAGNGCGACGACGAGKGKSAEAMTAPSCKARDPSWDWSWSWDHVGQCINGLVG